MQLRLALLLIPTLVTSGFKIGVDLILLKSRIIYRATKPAPEVDSYRDSVHSSAGILQPTNRHKVSMLPPKGGT